MARFTQLLAGVAGAALLLAGCTSTSTPTDPDDPLGLIEAGTLTICSEVPYEPFEYQDENSPTGYSGFDMDLIAEIASRMGLEIKIVESEFDALASGASLEAGSCDMAASAMTITPERQVHIDFSTPYYDSTQSLLVKKDSGYETLADLAGKIIGVQMGTTGESYAEENLPEGAITQSFQGNPGMVLALESNQVDALLQDLPVNERNVSLNPDFVIIEIYDTEEQYGFAYAKGQYAELQSRVNALLAELKADGTYDAIFAKYFID